MQCPRCGNSIDENSRFCKHCGYKILAATGTSDNIYDDRDYSYLSIIGIILGILSIVKFISIGGILLSILGVIISKMGMDESESGRLKGYGLGKIGFISSIVSLVIKIIWLGFSIYMIIKLNNNIFTDYGIGGFI